MTDWLASTLAKYGKDTPIKSVEFANPSNVVRLKPRVRIVPKQQPESAA